MIRAQRLHHIVLNVTDIEESVEFYTKVLGIKIAAYNKEKGSAFLSFGDEHHDLALFQRATGSQPDENQPGLIHMAFRLENYEKLQEAYEELLEMGIPIERTIQHNVTNSVYVKDPDGMNVEIFCDRFEDGFDVMKTKGPKSDHLDIRTGKVTPVS